jgi:hypothetical protein
MWQSCINAVPLVGMVEKAPKIVFAFKARHAKLLAGLANSTVLSQRIFNGVA